MSPSDTILEQGSTVNSARDAEFEEEWPYDVMTLIVLDEFPHNTLNQILLANQGCNIWLADTYANLPNTTDEALEGYDSVKTDDWRSPFIGQTVEDAVAWVRAIPKPGKEVTRTFCAVLQRGVFEESGNVLICKTPNEAVGRAEIQTIPCSAGKIGSFHLAFVRGEWADCYGEQRLSVVDDTGRNREVL